MDWDADLMTTAIYEKQPDTQSFSEETQKSVSSDLVGLIYSEIWPHTIPLVVSAIVAFTMIHYIGGEPVTIWFLGSLVAPLLQLLLILIYKDNPRKCNSIEWLRIYSASSFLSGCVYGIGYLFILNSNTENIYLPLITYYIIHLYMISSIALTHSAYFRAAELFIWPSLLFPACYTVVHPTTEYMIFGVVLLVFSLTMQVFGRKMNHMIVNSIRHEKEKESIAGELISANKQLYRAITAAENANQAKSSFLATVSHELRTPLNTIIGFSELMIQEVFGPLENIKYREYSEDILSSGRHLLELINDILDISKIEAGELKLDQEVVQLVTVVKSCVRLLAEKASKGGVKLETNFDKNVPQIIADERRLRQIGFNLISNAVKFTPAGGNVMISVSTSGDSVVLIVSDTGVGMKPEDIPIALKPFQQIPNHLSHGQEGTGLGLPLTKNLIELHNGTLRIESAPGAGTTVYATFPVFDVGSTMRRAEA